MGVSYTVYIRKPEYNKSHESTDIHCNCSSCCKTKDIFAQEYISKNQTRRLYAIQGITFGEHFFDHEQLKQISDNIQRVLKWYKSKIDEGLLQYIGNDSEDLDVTDIKQVSSFMDSKTYPDADVNSGISEITNSESFDDNTFEPILSELDTFKSEWINIEPDLNILQSTAEWFPWSYIELLKLGNYIYNCYNKHLLLSVCW